MSFTLAFFYADLGDPWWKTAVTEMLRSAKRVMPDAHIAQLSPAGTPMHPFADQMVVANLGENAPPVASMLSKVKGYLCAQYAMQAKQPVVFTDADVIWTDRPPINVFGSIGYDAGSKHLPYRQFFFQSHPDLPVLGETTLELLDELPPSTWAADVFELALNIEAANMDVKGYDANDTQKFMLHFPGSENRERMIAFARHLDRGEPFKELDPNHLPIAHSIAAEKTQLTLPKEGVNEDLFKITFG